LIDVAVYEYFEKAAGHVVRSGVTGPSPAGT
jgi:hypothetical protein